MGVVTKTGQIQSELPAVFGHGPARRDDAVGGLAPELVGVLGGWVGHVCRPFVVVGMHSKGVALLSCVSERTIRINADAFVQKTLAPLAPVRN